MKSLLASILKPGEVILLSKYLFDGKSAREIAAGQRRPRRTVAHRIGAAVRKLKAAGIDVQVPGPGRRQDRVHEVPIDPRAIGRLVITGKRHGGGPQGRWRTSVRLDRINRSDDDPCKRIRS